MNDKPTQQRFWPRHMERPIKIISMKLGTYTNIVGPTYSLDMSFKSASLYSGLRLIQLYPNPQKGK